jgi:hypothetical protein
MTIFKMCFCLEVDAIKSSTLLKFNQHSNDIFTVSIEHMQMRVISASATYLRRRYWATKVKYYNLFILAGKGFWREKHFGGKRILAVKGFCR